MEIQTNKQTKYEQFGTDLFNSEKPELVPLTTIVGVNCKNGIMLHTDSQETAEFEGVMLGFKRLAVTKLNDIGSDRHYLIGCAGTSSHDEILVSYLNEQLTGSTLYQEHKFYELLENLMVEFLEKYNITQPTRTHGSPVAPDHFISLSALLAAQISSESNKPKYALYKIETKPRLLIRRVPRHGSIGSGSVLVKLILDQLDLKLDRFGYNWQNISTKLAARTTYLILRHVLQTDLYTGGFTACRILDSEAGVIPSDKTQLWDDPYGDKLAQTLLLLCEELPNVKERLLDIVMNLNLFEQEKSEK